jgi:4-hydroxy-3-methylbut-2-en-1-yl diphosphate reductase
MKIERAHHLGMCFGVRDAIALAERRASDAPLTIFGQLVHNETVLSGLRSKGIQFAENNGAIETRDVMITAHGASETAKKQLTQQHRTVWEATCPLVHFAHRSLLTLVRAGFHPVVIGQKGHVEVRGLTDDLPEYDVILSETDIAQLQERPRFGVVSQTTQPIDRVKHLVQCLRSTFPASEVRFSDTVCQPTKQRQIAASELARKSDVVVVIGGANSNNTRELFKTCELYCSRVFHVQQAADLKEEWFFGAKSVGLTAGTSTPDSVIREIEDRLFQIAVCSK